MDIYGAYGNIQCNNVYFNCVHLFCVIWINFNSFSCFYLFIYLIIVTFSFLGGFYRELCNFVYMYSDLFYIWVLCKAFCSLYNYYYLVIIIITWWFYITVNLMLHAWITLSNFSVFFLTPLAILWNNFILHRDLFLPRLELSWPEGHLVWPLGPIPGVQRPTWEHLNQPTGSLGQPGGMWAPKVSPCQVIRRKIKQGSVTLRQRDDLFKSNRRTKDS